ncbi:ATP-grasp domain-containing protein [Methylosarcina fibrata]|uniref:ATP-grasp domain-containing protein n=1 Tax=Methylosarcina fibrata TaxID=105972 RepID=UPI00035EB9D8|nr:ATP-grasp domain-containing protein [Methylosarcina fibrata]
MRIWFNKTFSTIGAVLRQLKQGPSADDVTLICTHTHGTATAFLAADESYLEPAELKGVDYIEWCLEFCRQHRIDLFWPGKEAALIARDHALFRAMGVDVVSVAEYDTLTLLQNKADFYADLSPKIAETMDFVAVNDLAGFDAAVAELSKKHKKLCVKPAVSVYGLGFRVLDEERPSIAHLLKGVEYQIPLQELRQGMLDTPHFDTLLVMEHLGGPEWSVDCAGRNGELLCAVPRKKSQQAGHGQVIDHDDAIAGMVGRLTSHYRLNGLFNIQFREGVHGPRLLEINPRPSGGFGMSCLSGANLAQIALQALKGETPEPARIHYGLKVNEINTPVVL